jgi:hypothetical protein
MKKEIRHSLLEAFVLTFFMWIFPLGAMAIECFLHIHSSGNTILGIFFSVMTLVGFYIMYIEYKFIKE